MSAAGGAGRAAGTQTYGPYVDGAGVLGSGVNARATNTSVIGEAVDVADGQVQFCQILHGGPG
jgi:hypothetical protein